MHMTHVAEVPYPRKEASQLCVQQGNVPSSEYFSHEAPSRLKHIRCDIERSKQKLRL
jgi:hypothetical protein